MGVKIKLVTLDDKSFRCPFCKLGKKLRLMYPCSVCALPQIIYSNYIISTKLERFITVTEQRNKQNTK